MKYPTFINRTTIKWPEGATPRALILRKHDQSMMRRQISAQASVSLSPRLSLRWRQQILCKQLSASRTASASRLSFAYHI